MGRNFDDYPGFQPFRSWANTYAQDCKYVFSVFFQYANLFENNSSAEWCLYISEWGQGNMGLSNIRITTKVAVHALLGDTPTLVNYGSALMHNLGTREVKAAVRNLK